MTAQSFYEIRILNAPLAFKQDFDGGRQPIYVGEAAPGSLETESKWRIRKIIYSGNTRIAIQWANGVGSFVHRWDRRDTLRYL